MKESLCTNNTRTHTLALKENSFRGRTAKRLALGMSNPKKDRTARRKRNASPSPVNPVSTWSKALKFWKAHRGLISCFVDEMKYTGNRRDRRQQARQELALIRRPSFANSGTPFEFTKRGLRFVR